MNELNVKYIEGKDQWANGEFLARKMQEERQAHALSGFFFDFGFGETSSHKKMSQNVKTYAAYLMKAAKDEGKTVRVFKNMNGQIAASIE